LQNFSGERRRTICFLTERAANSEKIMASHNHGRLRGRAAVHRVRVITDMNDGRLFFRKSGLELARKQNELVDVAEPFGDETSGASKFSEKRPGRD